MPNSVRQWAHRKIIMAENNLKTAGCHLLEVATTYDTNHPDISEQLNTLNGCMVTIAETLELLRSSF